VKLRNSLCHGFFRNYEKQLLTADGRGCVIRVLHEAMKKLKEATDAARIIVFDSLGSLGFSEDQIEKERQRWLHEFED
jgi:hypothetical protein